MVAEFLTSVTKLFKVCFKETQLSDQWKIKKPQDWDYILSDTISSSQVNPQHIIFAPPFSTLLW